MFDRFTKSSRPSQINSYGIRRPGSQYSTDHHSPTTQTAIRKYCNRSPRTAANRVVKANLLFLGRDRIYYETDYEAAENRSLHP